MKNLLIEIAQHIVDYPEEVKVHEIDTHQSLILELSVAKQDLGMIIGKKGGNIGAIRTIMMAAAGKTNKRIIIEVMD